MNNTETFWHYYGIHLRGFADLGRYGWPASEAPTVAAKMRAVMAELLKRTEGGELRSSL